MKSCICVSEAEYVFEKQKQIVNILSIEADIVGLNRVSALMIAFD